MMAVFIGGLEARAAIFDFNGVITDDEELQFEIYQGIAAGLGLELSPPTYFGELSGLSDPEIVKRLLVIAGGDAARAVELLQLRIDQYRQRTEGKPPIRPEVAALVAELAGAIPLAVVSGAAGSEIRNVLSSAGLETSFQAIISIDDVSAGKPDPEGFLTALQRLGSIDPGQVVVFEDSPAGLAAAKAAGMPCIVAYAADPARMDAADRVLAALGPELVNGKVHQLADQVWGEDVQRISAIDLGITNRNYKVTTPSGSYMLRLPGERTEVLGIDRACEAEAAERADALAIGPPVLGPLPGVGTLITRFVDGAHATDPTDFQSRLPQVIEAVRTFHSSGPIKGCFPIHRVVEWHARDAAAHGVQPPKLYEPLLARSHAIEEAFSAAPQAEVPCHNDLLPANVLFDGTRVWLLDFEYAGMNDRFFDLGNLSVNSEFGPESDEELLTLYFGGVTPARWARLHLMKMMSEFREGMWGVVQQAISTLTNVDFVEYAEKRLESCQRIAESPDFDRWLVEAREPVA